MKKLYALAVTQTDLPLLKLLHNDFRDVVKTPPAGKYYLVFEVDEDGTQSTSKVMTKRAMLNEYDMPKRTPFLIALKERKS